MKWPACRQFPPDNQVWDKRVESFWMRCLDGGSSPPISTVLYKCITINRLCEHVMNIKIYLLAASLILFGSCENNSWWEPRTVTTYNSQDQATNRYQFTYDERGNRFTEIGEIWDNVSETWKKDYRISYSYDAYGIRTGALKEKRDNETNSWKPSSRIFYTYNPNTYLMDTESCQLWRTDKNEWEDSYKDHYIRDEKGDLLSVVREKWNNGEISRDVTLRGLFTVKAKVLTEAVVGWENYIRDAFTYSQEGTATGGNVDCWDKLTGQWAPLYRYLYTRDKRDNVIMESEDKWDETSGTWLHIGDYTYKYDFHNNVTEVTYHMTDTAEDFEPYLIFYYNKMASVIGYYIGDTGLFPGTRGTATYFRQKK